MKTIPELIEEKKTNFTTLLASRDQLVQQLNEINTTLLHLQGHLKGLNAAKYAAQDPSATPDDEQ